MVGWVAAGWDSRNSEQWKNRIAAEDHSTVRQPLSLRAHTPPLDPLALSLQPHQQHYTIVPPTDLWWARRTHQQGKVATIHPLCAASVGPIQLTAPPC
jgi:hypothetical protein